MLHNQPQNQPDMSAPAYGAELCRTQVRSGWFWATIGQFVFEGQIQKLHPSKIGFQGCNPPKRGRQPLDCKSVICICCGPQYPIIHCRLVDYVIGHWGCPHKLVKSWNMTWPSFIYQVFGSAGHGSHLHRSHLDKWKSTEGGKSWWRGCDLHRLIL